MARRSQYPEEFRQRAAQLVLDSHRSIRDVAAELGINDERLRNWVNAAKREQAGGSASLSSDERMELARRRLYRMLAISPTTFYTWARRPGGPTAVELADAYAINELHRAWVEHRRTYGARRLTAEIVDRGRPWNRKRVAG
jgi:transposase